MKNTNIPSPAEALQAELTDIVADATTNLPALTNDTDRQFLLHMFTITTGRVMQIFSSTLSADARNQLHQAWDPSPDTAQQLALWVDEHMDLSDQKTALQMRCALDQVREEVRLSIIDEYSRFSSSTLSHA